MQFIWLESLDMNLLEPWNTRFGLAPLDAISAADVAATMHAAAPQARSGMQPIPPGSAAPRLATTIHPQEGAEEPLIELDPAFYT